VLVLRRACTIKVLLAIVAAGFAALPPDAGAGNAIQVENSAAGTSLWQAPLASDRLVEGYASEISVAPGDTLHFHVSASPSASYRLMIYRLGWYGGRGGRLMACLPTCTTDKQALTQPMPPPDPATGEVRAGWPVTDTVQVGPGWVSGYYVAEPTLTTGPGAGTVGWIPFTVRAPAGQRSLILVQVPVNTWEAYNNWGGKSLYNYNSTQNTAAVAVSFDRPFTWDQPGAQIVSGWELPLVRFLEREGYDVSYQTDWDTDQSPGSLLGHRIVMTAGHGEYWTKGERDAFEAARDQGTNLAFMGSNTAYWQVRYADGGRTVIGYKSAADPIADPALKTMLFRALTPPRYECELIGIQHQGGLLNWNAADYTVNTAALGDPWFAGTGFTPGATVPQLVSKERDTIPGTQSAASSCGHALTVFFSFNAGGDYLGNGTAARYTAASGARVFASGSLIFSWALDSYRPPRNPESTAQVDPRVQQFVRNMLADMARPAPPAALQVAVNGGRVTVRVLAATDPRVTYLTYRHPGAGTFAPGDPGSQLVCQTPGTACIDSGPTSPGMYRYEVVAQDDWGSSAPVPCVKPARLRLRKSQ
jgi:hypothetical protein